MIGDELCRADQRLEKHSAKYMIKSVIKSTVFKMNFSSCCSMLISHQEIEVEMDHLGEQLCEVLEKVGTVEITVIVNIELGHKARDSPQLHDRLKGHFLHFIGHLWVL